MWAVFIVASLVGLPSSPTVLDVTQNKLGTCALRRDGAAVCWGRHPSFPAFAGARGRWRGGEVIGEPRVGQDITALRAVALSDDHGWGVTQAGQVIVWGSFSDPADSAKPRAHALRRMGTVSDAIDVVAFDRGACVRLRDGDLACWPTGEAARDDHAPSPPRRLRDENGARLPAGPLRELDAGDFAIGEGSDRVVVIARSVRSLLDPKADERSETARVQRSPAAHSGPEIGFVELQQRRPCAFEGGQLHCDAPRPSPFVVQPTSWGTADAVNPDDGWACSTTDRALRCSDREGNTMQGDLPAAASALELDAYGLRFATVEGHFGIVARKDDGSTRISILHEVGRGIAALGRIGEDWCATTRDGALWCPHSRDELAVVGGVGRVVELMASGRSLIVRIDRKGLSIIEGRGSDGTVSWEARPLPAASRLRSHVGVTDQGSMWIDADGTLVQLEEDTSVTPVEVPAALRSLTVASRPGSYARGTQDCLVTPGGEVHCEPPSRTMYSDVSLGLQPWKTGVDLPKPARRLWARQFVTCAQLEDRSAYCWGVSLDTISDYLTVTSAWTNVTAMVESAR